MNEELLKPFCHYVNVKDNLVFPSAPLFSRCIFLSLLFYFQTLNFCFKLGIIIFFLNNLPIFVVCYKFAKSVGIIFMFFLIFHHSDLQRTLETELCLQFKFVHLTGVFVHKYFLRQKNSAFFVSEEVIFKFGNKWSRFGDDSVWASILKSAQNDYNCMTSSMDDT